MEIFPVLRLQNSFFPPLLGKIRLNSRSTTSTPLSYLKYHFL
ncbi:hypothetical protein HMPREF1555_01273 [Porphyromonas gingivalis F0570]|uniref:Uncharacterized protein n=1 Tax=Porphyromonas gingivalis F0570 TaxID=1227271 RepID=A0A0E2M544_PORGN|nr:hypothetical protein HMPREF1555_01273 [Porphyromonas gingivalis F0570]